MKVVSFSLYGNNPIYTIGCIKNAELMAKFFSGWEMWVYYDDDVSDDILVQLRQLNVKLISMGYSNGYFASLWRFNPILDMSVKYFISRDCDSRISKRDRVAVDEWIDSGLPYHIIREHPIGHGWVINAGMWGAMGNSIKEYDKQLAEYLSVNHRLNDKSIDQCFLRDVIYPIISSNALIHDEYFKYEINVTNIKRDRALDNFAFIGESIDENDEPRGDQRTSIIKIYNIKK